LPTNHTRLHLPAVPEAQLLQAERLQPQAMRAGQSTRMGPGPTRCATRWAACAGARGLRALAKRPTVVATAGPPRQQRPGALASSRAPAAASRGSREPVRLVRKVRQLRPHALLRNHRAARPTVVDKGRGDGGKRKGAGLKTGAAHSPSSLNYSRAVGAADARLELRWCGNHCK
jgi:hypothetical protein